MLSEKIQTALNKQINEEFSSAYIYLATAAAADKLGLPGFVNWFKIQYEEELAHGFKIFNYVLERDGSVELDMIEKPKVVAASALELFEAALRHENHITQCIFKLKDLAKSEQDHATDVFLEWFVNEQVEEEASARGVIDQLKLVNENPNGLFMIDRELAKRIAEAVA